MSTYTCPMHPEVLQNSPGQCPKCGMNLVLKEDVKVSKPDTKKTGLRQYKPLFIIIGLIALAAVTASWNSSTFAWMNAMQYFMAGFFFVFSGFKLLDLAGFAKGYSEYDLLAKHWKGYGFVYPFIELLLGTGYILIPTSPLLHIITIVIMVFGGIGVSIKIAKHEKFQCACLGTFIDVPLTYITIVEDFGMAAMAIWMLLMY